MRVQLWSYNYDPEPLGIGPVSTTWAKAMSELGHQVEVVAAHPHYPEPSWGSRTLPYREVRDGIQVTRLPLLIGRESGGRRIIQEISFTACQALASPFLGSPDVLVSVSPSFPALLPAILNSKARRVPWVLWLQDILPDGAATTGYVDDGSPMFTVSRCLESSAYRAASRIVVLSQGFRENLSGKGVPERKLSLAYNPATITSGTSRDGRAWREGPPRVLCMGNIGRSQGLVSIVEAFEANASLEEIGAELIITGTGVAEAEVRAAIKTSRVRLLGVLGQEELERELSLARLGAVTQAYSGGEFNVPSKLMNYLAVGLPVVASVRPASEVTRIIERSGGGWNSDSSNPERFAELIFEALSAPDELERRGESGAEFARENLTPSALAHKFEAVFKSIPVPASHPTAAAGR